MPTPNLGITHTLESQDQKVPTINSAFDNLELALTDILVKAMADANQTLTTTEGGEALGNLVFQFTGALTANRNVNVPVNKKLYIATDVTTGGFTVTLKTSAGTGVVLPKSPLYVICWCDGTNVISLGHLNTSGQLVLPDGNKLPTAGVVFSGDADTGMRRDTGGFGQNDPTIVINGLDAIRMLVDTGVASMASETVAIQLNGRVGAKSATIILMGNETSGSQGQLALGRVVASSLALQLNVTVGSPKKIIRLAGSWVTDGFAMNHFVRTSGFSTSNGANNGIYKVSAISTTSIANDTLELTAAFGNEANMVAETGSGDEAARSERVEWFFGMNSTSYFVFDSVNNRTPFTVEKGTASADLTLRAEGDIDSTSQPRAHATTTDEAIVTGTTLLAVSMDTQVTDTQNIFPAPPASTMTIPTSMAGFYAIDGAVHFKESTSGGTPNSGTIRRVAITRNGATTVLGGGQGEASISPQAAGDHKFSVSALIQLAAADVIRLSVAQDSGGNMNVDASLALVKLW